MGALELEKETRIYNVEALHSAFPDIHNEVSVRNERNHSKVQTRHNIRTNVLHQNFAIGDFVVVRLHARRRHKTADKIYWNNDDNHIKIYSFLCGARVYVGETWSFSCSKNDFVPGGWQRQATVDTNKSPRIIPGVILPVSWWNNQSKEEWSRVLRSHTEVWFQCTRRSKMEAPT